MAAGLMIAAVAYASFARGASHGAQFSIVLAMCVAGLCLELGQRAPLGLVDFRHPLVIAVLLSIATLISAAAADSIGTALPVFGLILVVTAALIVAGGQPPEVTNALIQGLTGCAVLVAATAWIGVAFHHRPWALPIEDLWRGASTITYSNAAASFLGMMLVVAFARLAYSPSRSGAITCWALAVGLTTTMSRAGIASTAIGLAIVALAAGLRRSSRAAFLVAPGVVLTVAGLLPGIHHLHPARPVLATAGALLGMVLVFMSWSRVTLAVTIMVCVLTAYLAAGLSGGTDEVVSQVGRTRLVVTSDDRAHEWHAAYLEFAARPLLGQGPGLATYTWTNPDGRHIGAKYAHNEYLELLANNGLVGLAALVTATAVLAHGTRMNHPPEPDPDDGHRIGIAAALTAFMIHSGLDFLWHIPVLPLTAALLAGSLLRPTRSHLRQPRTPESG